MHPRLSALREPRFRRIWIAHAISLTGTWMQNLALPWLAYLLTGSPLLLGLIGAAQALPVTILSPFAGAMADRMHRRTLLIVTQSLLMASSALLAMLVFADAITYTALFCIALFIGLANAFDYSARQVLTADLVHPDHLTSAIALNAATFSTARVIGPAIAGAVMVTAGIGWCFAINALSFIPFLAGIAALAPAPAAAAGASAAPGYWSMFGEGLRYLRGRPDIRDLLLMVAMMGILAFNLSVFLPVLLTETFGLGESAYGLLISSFGLGSLLSALALAVTDVGRRQGQLLDLLPLASGLLFLAISQAPSFLLLAGLAAGLGFANLSFFTVANSRLQALSEPAYRGRMIGFYVLGFAGMTPVGNLLAGALVERLGVGVSLLATGAALILGNLLLRLARRRPPPA